MTCHLPSIINKNEGDTLPITIQFPLYNGVYPASVSVRHDSPTFEIGSLGYNATTGIGTFDLMPSSSVAPVRLMASATYADGTIASWQWLTVNVTETDEFLYSAPRRFDFELKEALIFDFQGNLNFQYNYQSEQEFIFDGIGVLALLKAFTGDTDLDLLAQGFLSAIYGISDTETLEFDPIGIFALLKALNNAQDFILESIGILALLKALTDNQDLQFMNLAVLNAIFSLVDNEELILDFMSTLAILRSLVDNEELILDKTGYITVSSPTEFPITTANMAKYQAVYSTIPMVEGYTGTLFTIRRLSDNATYAVTPVNGDIDKAAINAWRAGADCVVPNGSTIPNQLVGVKGTTITSGFPTVVGDRPFITSNVYNDLETIFQAENVPNRLIRNTDSKTAGIRINGGNAGHLSASASGISTANGLEMHLLFSPTNRKAPTANTGSVTSVTPTAGGSGYSSSLTRPIIGYLTGGGVTDTVASFTPIISGGTITGFTLVSGGTGYTTAPLVWISDTTGSGCSATATISGGAVTAVTVSGGNVGSGYSAGATVVFLGGNKVGLIKCYHTVGAITSTKLVETERGYTSNPSVTIANPHGGIGATFNVATNLLGDALGSDSRGEILLSYGPSASNNATLKMFSTSGNTFSVRRIATADGGTDQFGNVDSYTMNANSLQIISWNIRDTADTTKIKVHSFGASPSAVTLSAGNQTANTNAGFQNATLKIGAGISTTGSWASGGTGNSNGDFVFGALIISESLTESERRDLHGKMRLKAEPSLNLSKANLEALFSERLDFRDVDGSRLLMGKNGKLALQFNVSTPFGGFSPNFTYGATSNYLGLTGVKFNDDTNLANTFQSVTTGTASFDYWTQQNEGSYLVIGARDATGGSGYTTNLGDWFSIGTGNPPDQTAGAKPVNNSFGAIWHHSQPAMLTKIADTLDPNGKTGVTAWNDQGMWQAGMKYFYPTAHGGLDEFQLLPSTRTVEGTSYPIGTLLHMELLEGTLNKYAHTPEMAFIGGNSINTPKNFDYVMSQIGTFKNGVGYNKGASQASRDANARTATVKSYVAPLTGLGAGDFDCSYARQIGTANNVHSVANSKWLKGVDGTNIKAHMAFIGVSEREWTESEILKIQANAFKLVN